MPEVSISIGSKEFLVACQEGEEQFLQSAAAMLDREAQGLVSQVGRMPAEKMLLMAGLMLADRTAAYEARAQDAEEKLGRAEEKLVRQEELVERIKSAPSPEPQKVEVPVIPDAVRDSLEEIAARAEALASYVEEATGAGER